VLSGTRDKGETGSDVNGNEMLIGETGEVRAGDNGVHTNVGGTGETGRGESRGAGEAGVIGPVHGSDWSRGESERGSSSSPTCTGENRE